MEFKILKILFFFNFILIGCTQENVVENDFKESLTVEGYVRDQQSIKVYLSSSLPFKGIINESDLLKAEEGAAKVTISNGKNSEILILNRKTTRYPTLVYESEVIKGVSGEVYELNVLLNDVKYTANTIVPEKPTIETMSQVENKNGVGLKISLKNSSNKNYYKILVKNAIERNFKWATPYLLSDDLIGENENIDFVLEYLDNDITDQDISLFKKRQSYNVKIISIDKAEYDFYNSAYGDDIDLFRTATFSEQIETNINGGNDVFGFWAGENELKFTITIE